MSARASAVVIIVLAACAGACTRSQSKQSRPSPDGVTRLVFARDPDLPDCRWAVDGKPWPWGSDTPGAIDAGVHTVGGKTPDGTSCGEIELELKPGRITTVDDFGP